jgi:hypothetical protein
MRRYHISPDGVPKICTAQPGACRYGADAPHFVSKEDAAAAYEQKMNEEAGTFVSHKKLEGATKVETLSLTELDRKLEALSFEELEEYANESEENHKALDALIDKSAQESLTYYNLLDRVNPYNPDAENPITKKAFRQLKKERDAHRNYLATLVEAHVASRFYKPKSSALDPTLPLGTSVPVTSYEQTDPRWYSSRTDTVGGSEVGALVLKEFVPPAELSNFDKLYISRVEKSKVTPPTDEEIADILKSRVVDRSGALYRGTVWEDRIRDKYTEDHPELTVYHGSGQYAKEGREWQRVNFDGVLSDRADGKPNGALEIKTGGDPDTWADGVPTAYRAQTLYSLNATGFEYADIRVLLNDGETRDYRIHSTDEIYPGSGVSTEDFVSKNVDSWFKSLKAQRVL